MGSIIGGGGGGGGPAPDTTTQFIREAPGIEERKLELMDLARQTAQGPISIPDIQVQGLSPLEQAAITQAGQTGVGAGAVGQAITGTQAAMGAPNISQFYNPYQSYVLDEINRQSAMRQNVLAGQAVGAGAFGGGRQGIQTAEEERARLGQLGQAQAVGFQSALQAAQQQQAAQRAGSAQLGTLGQLQQEMAGTDISRQITAGGLQRQLGQAQLDASRQTQLQRSAEPLQRLEFLSNIYAAGPKSTSGITAATLPQSSPLAQSIGTGLGVAQAYQNMGPGAQTALATKATGGLIEAANYRVKKFNTGGSVSDDDDESADLLNDEYTGSVPQYISPEQRRNLMLRPLTSQLLQATRRPGQSEASAVAGALGRGLESQQDTALQLTKYDAAVKAAQEKAKGSAKGATSTSVLSGLQLGQLMGQTDPEGNIVPVGNEEDQFVVTSGPEGFKIGEKTYDSIKEQGTVSKEFQKLELDQMENAIDILERTLNTSIKREGIGVDLPGAGPIGGRVPLFLTSRAGKALRADFERASNILLKLRSGAAVTEPEMNRFMQEMSGGTSTADESLLFRNINILRQDLENRKMGFIKQYGGTRAMEKFLKEGAIKLKSSPLEMEKRIRYDFKGQFEPNPFSESSITLDDGTRYLDINGTVFMLNPETNTYEYAPPKGKKGG
jgi:hypothetical protein